MRRRLAVIAVLVATLAAVVAVTATANTSLPRPARAPRSPAATSPAAAAHATDVLATGLLKAFGAGNTIFSPYSVETALAMVDQGARGATASQIAHVLDGESGAGLARANAALSALLAAQPRGGPTLSGADGLWVQSGLRLRPAFQQALSDDFGAPANGLDFATDPASAAQTINQWASDHTHGLISELMPPGSVTGQTMLVLASALYLSAHWQTAFDPNLTVPGPFHPSAASTVRVPFMTTQDGTRFPYGRTRGYQALALPYRNSSLSLLVVMPSQGKLGSFVNGLTASSIEKIAASLRPATLLLRMPKLSLALRRSLNGALAGLGMPLAFSDGADLTGISPGQSLKIQQAEHAAVIKLNEAGTVAAAATGISLQPTAIAVPQGIPVAIDHPFLMFVRDSATGTILFAARVSDPSS